MSIRAAALADIPHIARLAIDTEMFPPEEAGFVHEMVPGSLDGSLPDDVWLVHETDGRVTGAAYYAPEPHAPGIFNVYFISVDPAVQG
ncbi:MAG: GNAT family N-acetyltransferase, partial [Myxococcota bacterium]